MSDYTTVSIPREKKEAVDEAIDAFEDEYGFRPRKGDVVIHACREFADSTYPMGSESQ